MEWVLLSIRWVHITAAVSWIGTSIFFMWLDRSFKPAPGSKRPGSLGELWMVHGGGFYRVEKLHMGSTQVPPELHWFKWESYWTWLTGMVLLALMFYTGEGALLLDPEKTTTYGQAVTLSVTSIIVSWFFYDRLWELGAVYRQPWLGHSFTLLWVLTLSWVFCHYLGGRAAFMHLGAVIGTWMSGNVFLRIIPRQILMVEASKTGSSVNETWPKNAKARSTHNTYFTLPIIFIMLSNHFPSTYGSSWNWLLVLWIGAAGAAIRHFFVIRLSNPGTAKLFLAAGTLLLFSVFYLAQEIL